MCHVRPLILTLVGVLLAACASGPKPTPGKEPPDFSVLPAGADAYLGMDVKHLGPLLAEVEIPALGSENKALFLDKADHAAMAFFLGGERRFSMAGWGNFPSAGADMSMSLSGGWKKRASPTGNKYWYSEAARLGLAVGPRLALASDSDPFDAAAFGSGQAPAAPGGFEDFSRPLALAGWLSEPAALVETFLTSLAIPVTLPARELFFGIAVVSAGYWQLVFQARTDTPSQAKGAAALFSLARLFSGDGSGPNNLVKALLATPPVQEDDILIITSEPLPAAEMTLLFDSFLVYFM